MKAKVVLNRALIAIESFFRGRSRGKIDNKIVLIVFQQLFGDAVVIQNSLEEYTRLFPQLEGWSIHFLVCPSVLAFMKDILPLPEEIFFEEVDFKHFLENYTYYREIVAKYKDIAGTIIVPGTSLSAEIFVAAMNAKRKIGLIRSIDVIRPWIYAYFYNNAYTEIVRPNKEDMMLQRHRMLINYLGDKDYRASLSRLIDKAKIIEGKYAVICPGASKIEKCWPIERFTVVADYLVEQYGLDIHLCGGIGEEMFAEQMKDLSKHKEQIINHIGETSFSEWSAIVQNADIVVGNDKVDVDEEKLPVTVLKDMPCEWCRTIGYDAGYGNEKCKKAISEGYSAICISNIETSNVIEVVNQLLRK